MVGPLLLQDVHMVETLAHFVRERIPERCDFFDGDCQDGQGWFLLRHQGMLYVHVVNCLE